MRYTEKDLYMGMEVKWISTGNSYVIDKFDGNLWAKLVGIYHTYNGNYPVSQLLECLNTGEATHLNPIPVINNSFSIF